MWLISKDILEKMKLGMSTALSYSPGDLTASLDGDGPRIMRKAGSTVEIFIYGVLTQSPDFYAQFYGGGNTTYSEVINAIVLADQDPAVNEIVLRYQTPGGQVSGLFAAMQAIRSAKTPTTSIIDDMALSAGYALASQGDKIIAINKAAFIGSIGVALDTYLFEGETSITNRASKDKRPDLKTADGVAVVQDELDEIHAVIGEAMAAGRGVSLEALNTQFGKGRTFLAETALAAGMIDAIDEIEKMNQHNNGGGKAMTIEELRAAHPVLYSAVVAEGVASERDRVGAHLTFAESNARAMPVAVKAIKAGSEMTQTLIAEYTAIIVSGRDIEDRLKDEEDISGLETPAEQTTSNADKVADLVCQQMGVTQ